MSAAFEDKKAEATGETPSVTSSTPELCEERFAHIRESVHSAFLKLLDRNSDVRGGSFSFKGWFSSEPKLYPDGALEKIEALKKDCPQFKGEDLEFLEKEAKCLKDYD